MKKSIVLGTAVILVGIFIFVGAFWTMGFDWTKFDTENSERAEQIIDFVGSSIVIDEDNNNITVGVSPDDKVHITYGKSEKTDLEIESGETLTVKRKNSARKWYDYIVVNVKSVDTKILLPESFAGDMEITNSNGRINIDGVYFGNLTAKTKNGKVKLKNTEVADTLAATTNNGGIYCESVSAIEFKVKTKNGEVELNNIESLKVSANTDNGNVKISDINSGNISLETENGYIKGDINGAVTDYFIKSETKNGSNNLPQETFLGDKKLYVRTYNGDIKIKFK
jgi:DUF4097 and DUF4098 domain-containing protein YvlB